MRLSKKMEEATKRNIENFQTDLGKILDEALSPLKLELRKLKKQLQEEDQADPDVEEAAEEPELRSLVASVGGSNVSRTASSGCFRFFTGVNTCKGKRDLIDGVLNTNGGRIEFPPPMLGGRHGDFAGGYTGGGGVGQTGESSCVAGQPSRRLFERGGAGGSGSGGGPGSFAGDGTGGGAFSGRWHRRDCRPKFTKAEEYWKSCNGSVIALEKNPKEIVEGSMVKGLKGHLADTSSCVSHIRKQGKELAINMRKDLYTNPFIFEEIKQSNGLAHTKIITLNKGKSFGLTEIQPILSCQAFKPNHTNPKLKCQPNPSSCKPTHPSKHKPPYVINPSKSEIGPKYVVPNSKPKSPTKTFNPWVPNSTNF